MNIIKKKPSFFAENLTKNPEQFAEVVYRNLMGPDNKIKE